jgi:MoaA/NifB/PqqE/SkfB family radical SAM enzyme
MSKTSNLWAEVDENGRLVLPPELVSRYGLTAGAKLRVDLHKDAIRLHRPVTHLAKIYVEPTNFCNLNCVTCMRNNWQVTIGHMSPDTFDCLIDGLETALPPPLVLFGGIGEPLTHARLPEMIARVKQLGSTVEVISNGTLLTETVSRKLIDAGLDTLWVSLDGARPESYADVRLGAELPKVLDNLDQFRRLRKPAHRPVPQIGIAFVAMKRNIADLPELLAIGKRLGVMRFHVSNLLPHTAAMDDEILYRRNMRDITYLPSPWLRQLQLPKMDINEYTSAPILKALNSGYNVEFAGSNLGLTNDVCTFIEAGSLTVGWDGTVAPCPPLLYTHIAYLQGYERVSSRHPLGNIRQRSLRELWLDPEYVDYRERVHQFAFAPCSSCGGCDLSRDNDTDCFDSISPACGGCLWAQGVIRCP